MNNTNNCQCAVEKSDPSIGTLNFTDKYEMNIAVKSMDWALAMFDLDIELRGVLRSKTHIGEFSGEFVKGVEWARDRLFIMLEQNGVNLEDIK